jgi:hypothetical protein
MDHELAARRIASWYGDAQLVFLLRHPAARAVSNYYFTRNNGFEHLPMAEAFSKEDRRRDAYDRNKFSTSPFAYLKRGHYINDIRMYARHFERPQMLLLIEEELVGNIGQIQALYQALGVKRDFVPPSLRTVVNSGNAPDERPDPEIRDFLDRYFVESIAELEDYMGRSIKAWRRQPIMRVAG